MIRRSGWNEEAKFSVYEIADDAGHAPVRTGIRLPPLPPTAGVNWFRRRCVEPVEALRRRLRFASAASQLRGGTRDEQRKLIQAKAKAKAQVIEFAKRSVAPMQQFALAA